MRRRWITIRTKTVILKITRIARTAKIARTVRTTTRRILRIRVLTGLTTSTTASTAIRRAISLTTIKGYWIGAHCAPIYILQKSLYTNISVSDYFRKIRGNICVDLN